MSNSSQLALTRQKLETPLQLTAENVTSFTPTSDDITYTHSVFAQCFLPLRKPRDDARSYEVKHGRASLAIDAGRLIDPNTGDLVKQDVPHGSAARIVLAHINNHAIRAASIEAAMMVPMGESLRAFFNDHRLKIGGKNAKQICAQTNNIAAAHITIGTWNENTARQINLPPIAEEINFWMETDDRQRTLWQPSVTLNKRYVEIIRDHSVPLDMRALVGLYEKPRAMDVFTWLSYRLPRVNDHRGIFVPYEGQHGLHDVFGRNMKDKSVFRSQFQKTLKDVFQWYPEARLNIMHQGLLLYPSPSPIPRELDSGKTRSLFFLPR